MESLIQLPSEKAIQGINNLFDDYIKLSKNDVVLVCFWHECREIVAWIIYELERREQNYQFYCYTHRDEAKFADEVAVLLNTRDNYALLVCEEEVLAFSSSLRSFNACPNIKVWRIMNTSAHLFEQAFAVETRYLQNINSHLLSKLNNTPQKKLYIENELGTRLEVTLDNTKYQWISTYGVQKKNELIILPTGEVNTYPASISGTFVAFGAIHANIQLPFDTRLQGKPVTLEIHNSVLQRFTCADAYLNSFLEIIFNEEHLIKVGEFGIGTNIGITDFVATNSHINERFPGVHLGLGMHLQPSKLVKYTTPIHMDFISPYGHLIFDDKTPTMDLRNLGQFAKIDIPHPPNISAEDGE